MNDDTLIKKLKKKKIAPPCGLTWKEHDMMSMDLSCATSVLFCTVQFTDHSPVITPFNYCCDFQGQQFGMC